MAGYEANLKSSLEKDVNEDEEEATRAFEFEMSSQLGNHSGTARDPADQFLNFMEWWSSNAVKPVSVEWSPVAEAKATTYRCGERVINLAQTTREVAEKILELTNEL